MKWAADVCPLLVSLLRHACEQHTFYRAGVGGGDSSRDYWVIVRKAVCRRTGDSPQLLVPLSVHEGLHIRLWARTIVMDYKQKSVFVMLREKAGPDRD